MVVTEHDGYVLFFYQEGRKDVIYLLHSYWIQITNPLYNHFITFYIIKNNFLPEIKSVLS